MASYTTSSRGGVRALPGPHQARSSADDRPTASILARSTQPASAWPRHAWFPPLQAAFGPFAPAAARLALLGATALLAPALGGCAARPAGRLSVSEVKIVGPRQVPPGDIIDRLATKATSTLLGFTLQYEAYDRFVLERDLQRIERYYQARGYYGARVQAGRVIRGEDDQVRIEVLVEEGAPVRLAEDARIDRVSEPAEPALAPLKSAQEKLGKDAILDEDTYAAMRRDLLRALTDHGHAHARLLGGFSEADLSPDSGHPRRLDPARVAELEAAGQLGPERRGAGAPPAGGPPPPEGSEGAAEASQGKPARYGVRIDAVGHTAEVFLLLDPGPVCHYGEIKIDGLGGLPKEQVRRAMRLRNGGVYSTADLESARHAMLELGVFSSVEYVVELNDDRRPEVPVTFKVAVAPLHTITFGGGVQADVLQTDAHFLAAYEHENFLGGLRRLTVQVRPGMVLFPTNLQNLLPPERALPELRTRAELRQPQFLEARTRATLRSEFNVYPFLLPARTPAEVPDVVVGYREIRESFGVDRSFLKRKLSFGAAYNFQLSYPFSYVGPLDQGIQRVLVSYVSLTQAVDLRDNAIKPRQGVYFSNEIQLAGGLLGGDADDIKIQPDLRLYAPLTKKITLAMRGSVGFLFPRSYGSTLGQTSPDRAVDPLGAFTFEAQRNRDLQLLFFRAFFSGGPNSNRGYALRGVGPWGIAPFRLGGATALRDCVGRVPGGAGVPGAATQLAKLPDIDPLVCSVPLGGLSLWEWSGEIRLQLTESIATLLFLDAGDVTRDRVSLRLNYPHLTAGTGLRIDTPVGPVRLDVGYAVPGLQHIGGTLDPLQEGEPATFLGLPLALNIAVGEAF